MASTTPKAGRVTQPRTPRSIPTTPVGLTTRRRAKRIEYEEELARLEDPDRQPPHRSLVPTGQIPSGALFTPPTSPQAVLRSDTTQYHSRSNVVAPIVITADDYIPAFDESRAYDGPTFAQEDVDRLDQLRDLPSLDGPYGRHQTPAVMPWSNPDVAPAIDQVGCVLTPSKHLKQDINRLDPEQLAEHNANMRHFRGLTPGYPCAPTPETGDVSLPGVSPTKEFLPSGSIFSHPRGYTPDEGPWIGPVPTPGLRLLSLPPPSPIQEDSQINERLGSGPHVSPTAFVGVDSSSQQHYAIGPVRHDKKPSLRGHGKPSTAPISLARPRRISANYNAKYKF